MPIRGVIFDLGGTLLRLPPVDIGRVRRDCDAHLRRFLRAAGVTEAQADVVMAEVQAAVARRARSGSRAQLTLETNLARALRRSGVRMTPRMVGAAALSWWQPEFGLWQPAEGAGDVLAALHAARVRVGLCSNTASHAYIVSLLAAHHLDRHLDPVVSSAGVGWRKPDRRAFLPLLQAWGLPPEQIAMVGDDLECDIAGAAALGMRTVWVTAHSRSDPASYCGPEPWRVAADLREVPGMLDR